MNLTLVLAGVAIGFAFSAPVGPVNLLCVRKTISAGFRAGLFTGIGATVADVIYATLGAFGVTAVLTFIEERARLVESVGGGLVIAFGIATLFRTSPAALVHEKAMERYKGLFAGFAMTIANPGVLFGFIAVFGGFGKSLITPGDFSDAATLVFGIGCGSMLWWTILSAIVLRLKKRLDGAWFKTVNAVSGYVLIAFGAGLLIRAAFNLG